MVGGYGNPTSIELMPKNWELLTTQVQPGDLICVKHLCPGDYLADAIEWFQNGDVSHTLTCLGEGKVVDVQPTGIREALLDDFLREDYRLTLRRLVVSGRGDDVARAARAHIGSKYDLKAIVAAAVFGILGKLRMFPLQRWFGKAVYKSSRAAFTCSEEYAMAVWQGAGIDIMPGRDFDMIRPHDLLVSPLLETKAAI
jgi:hypothetical protein